MLFSIELNEHAWTLGQLWNLFKIEGNVPSKYTLAFFNYLFSSEEELKEEVATLDLSKPIIILIINRQSYKKLSA